MMRSEFKDALVKAGVDKHHFLRSLVFYYGGLSLLEKQILQVCSVFFIPLSTREFLELTQTPDLQLDAIELADQDEIRQAFESLKKGAFLLQSQNQHWLVNPWVQDIAVQDAVKNGIFESCALSIQKHFPNDMHAFGQSSVNVWRDIRIAFYRGKEEAFFTLMRMASGNTAIYNNETIVPFLYPFNETIFERLPHALQNFFLNAFCDVRHYKFQEHLAVYDDDRFIIQPSGEPDEQRVELWMNALVGRGDIEGLRALHSKLGSLFPQLEGCAAFLEKRDGAALKAFEQAEAIILKSTRKKTVLLPSIAGVFYALLLLKQNTQASAKKLSALVARGLKKQDDADPVPYECLQFMVRAQSGQTNVGENFSLQEDENSLFDHWLIACSTMWFVDQKTNTIETERFQKAYDDANQAGLTWIAFELATFLSKFSSKEQRPKFKEQAAELRAVLGTTSRMSSMEKTPEWKRKLTSAVQVARALQSPESEFAQKKIEKPQKRLIWELVENQENHDFSLKPILQEKQTQGKNWKRGRSVSLSRLKTEKQIDEAMVLTKQDQAILDCFENQYVYSYSSNDFVLNIERVSEVISGHPLIFEEGDRSAPMDIQKRPPGLLVSETEKRKIKIAFDPEPVPDSNVVFRKEGPHKATLFTFGEVPSALFNLLSKPIFVPHAEKEQIMEAIEAISPLIAVHTEVEGTYDESLASPADQTPHVHLLPYKEGIRMQLYVRPFGKEQGPYFCPGEGSSLIAKEIKKQNRFAKRDLRLEEKIVRALFTSQPHLAKCAKEKKSKSWREEVLIESAEDALEVLLELKKLADEEQIILHWPKGEVFNLVRSGSQSFSVKMKKKNQWFEASASLQIDEDLVLNMQQILDLKWVGGSRFAQLDDGRFVAITQALRSRMEGMRLYSAEKGKDVLRFAPVQAVALESMFEEEDFNIDADDEWEALSKKIQDAQKLSPPVPKELNASLRDYQKEGFHWLCRLAAWDAGACLADDMGLGKTLQALALLARRAPNGPALVVAPTSLVLNWNKEAAAFAPSLKIHVLNEKSNRKKAIASMKKHDVLLCSYGLLDVESEALASQHWRTTVLDEAQAIKNHATKRSKAAMGLSSDFRIILTGTPVENHLEELWNLFRFINPGLLGSKEHFRKTYVEPITQFQSEEVREHLKALIHPFVLRRTKPQVLKELPEKTEIALPVELHETERAFYEALREKAQEKVTTDDQGSQMPMQILAELMRLRRACCHPKLVDETSQMEGSKLKVFTRLIDDLVQNDHKVLVFSQFVDCLSLMREALEEKNISYEYLDGQTPAKSRQKRVDAFQQGSSPVFLISLKAGGFGLNLTAADYVIHYDPWWNPAVEDQASDRAHRIGQKRAVTVYRLITQNTIEEKIVQLHHEKRNLADKLLEGTDRMNKLTAKELLKLIQSA